MRRVPRVATLALAAVIALSGCTATPSPGEDLRTLVVAAADSAAAGDLAGASAAIDELEARVIAARDSSGLTAEEADGILATIALVRADLAALAQPPATETETPVAPVEEQEPAVVPGDQDDSGGDDGGDDGGGNDKGEEGGGNGNGNEGNRGKGNDKDKGGND